MFDLSTLLVIRDSGDRFDGGVLITFADCFSPQYVSRKFLEHRTTHRKEFSPLPHINSPKPVFLLFDNASSASQWSFSYGNLASCLAFSLEHSTGK